jgi:chromosome segregation ATPase
MAFWHLVSLLNNPSRVPIPSDTMQFADRATSRSDRVRYQETFMAINVRNASQAGASDSLESLRETIGSLEAQVTSLYEEREAAGAATAGGDNDGLLALYEQKAAVSKATIDELRAVVQSFEEQLQSLYQDRESGNAGVDDSQAEALESLEAQLHSLYADREADGDTLATIDGLNAQLTSLYDERQAQGDLSAVIDGLEAQLTSLYREREDGVFASEVAGTDVASLIATVQSFEAQLEGFYEAQASATYGLSEANEMVRSLEPQVAALLEERNELADQLQARQAELERSRSKAKDMVAALMDSALA